MSRAQEIADSLIGTAQSVHDVATEDECENDAVMSELYTLAFECDRCGWWASTEELNNEDDEELCDECDERDKDGSD